jgi:hypothetical protein
MTSITLSDIQVADRSPIAASAASGAPAMLLRLEGAAAFALSLAAYARLGEGWVIFAVLFLVPDLSMLGYFAGRRVGAAAYNAAHTYLVPAALCAAGLALGQAMMTAIGLIWVAHIGLDRMLGYGLKYSTAFGHTHLGMKGRG